MRGRAMAFSNNKGHVWAAWSPAGLQFTHALQLRASVQRRTGKSTLTLFMLAIYMIEQSMGFTWFTLLPSSWQALATQLPKAASVAGAVSHMQPMPAQV